MCLGCGFQGCRFTCGKDLFLQILHNPSPVDVSEFCIGITCEADVAFGTLSVVVDHNMVCRTLSRISLVLLCNYRACQSGIFISV